MSHLPEIDYNLVIQRLGNDLGTLAVQKAKLELLAEAIRTERDSANAQLESVVRERDALIAELKRFEDGGSNAA